MAAPKASGSTTPDEPGGRPFVSVIIPVYNDPVRLKRAVEALCKQDYPKDRFEIMVADNGSAPRRKPKLGDLPVRMVEETAVRSSYAARNRGVRAAQGEILAFTDSDCRPASAWLTSGVAALLETGAALAGGRMRYRFSAKRTAAEVLDALTGSEIRRNIDERGVTITANLFVRKEVFEAVGPFPSTVISGGDIYFTARAAAAGHRIVYAPAAVVEHPARTFIPLMKRFFRIGIGKASLRRLPVNAAGSRLTAGAGRRNPLRQLHPLDLRKRLRRRNCRVPPIKLFAVLLSLYAALAATALGVFAEWVRAAGRRLGPVSGRTP